MSNRTQTLEVKYLKSIMLVLLIMVFTNVKAKDDITECRVIPMDELAYMEKKDLIHLGCISSYGVRSMSMDKKLFGSVATCHEINLKRVPLVLKKDHGTNFTTLDHDDAFTVEGYCK